MPSAEKSLKPYRKRPGNEVVAVRLDLDTEGFEYQKWGATQRCSQGDWLVHNDGDTYTVAAETFARTYRETDHGRYAKTTPVWARKAGEAGEIATKEGKTTFQAGDYLVYNAADGSDGYAVSAARFEKMYEPVE